MLPCDLRFAESKTKFIENFYYMGVTPDLSSSYFLPRLIGLAKTKELILTGRIFTAKEAEHWGLFYRVVDKRSEMMQEVDRFCQDVLQGDSSTISQMKELLADSSVVSLEKHLKKEQEYLINHLVKPETIARLQNIQQRRLN
jgi:2-(1,2-epoxy-1,2-dihydrophenyl)acetyl-CoA isomerase